MSTFNVVAHEYYDSVRHPTCHNFRSASSLLLAGWFNRFPLDGLFCEVGVGRSVLAELFSKRGLSLQRLTLLDDSAAMLEYSREYQKAGAQLRVGNAEALPLETNSMDCLVSSLGDPYNRDAFWVETHRVLRPGGMIAFTVPAYEWAKAFRHSNHLEGFTKAEFELANGNHVSLPSYILSEQEQRQKIAMSGLVTLDVSHARIKDLRGEKLSRKLLAERGSSANIVTGYLAQKPAELSAPRPENHT